MKIKYDKDKNAIINPFGKCEEKLPNIAVACYSDKITKFIINNYDGKLVCKVSKTEIYKINFKNKYFVLFTSPVGAPWATMVMEDLIFLGVKKFIYFGSCGVLENISQYQILIPEMSKREEGTSYHYIPKLEYISMNEKYKYMFIKILEKENYNYQLCKTWTTDAPYRETPKKVKEFLSKGIKCVEMESSALAAVAQFRNVDIFIFFYAADELSKNKWNKRCLGNKELDNKTYLAILALKLGVEIMKEKI